MLRFSLLAAVLFILAGTASADKKQKKDDTSYHVQLYLRDGSIVDGFIRTSLNFEATSVGIGATPRGKFKTYNS